MPHSRGVAMGSLSVRQVRVSRRLLWHRPRLEVLEARLPPGDALLGVLVSGALLAPALADGGTELGTTDLGIWDDLSAALPVVAPREGSSVEAVAGAGSRQSAEVTDGPVSWSAGVPLDPPGVA